MQDPTEFRERFALYKEGKQVYKDGLPAYVSGKGVDYEADTADFLKKYEGFRDTVYLDGKGIKTIGYGFTDPKFINKGKISRSEADVELRRQIRARLTKLRDTLGHDIWDNLSNDSKKALTSYHFNYPAGFKDTTRFMKYWRQGNYDKAISEVDAGMNDPANPGLRKRRLAEQELLRSDPFLIKPVESLLVKLQQIIEYPDALRVFPVIPEQQVRHTYDNVLASPYVTGKPMVRLLPRVNDIRLLDLVESSRFKPLFPIEPDEDIFDTYNTLIYPRIK